MVSKALATASESLDERADRVAAEQAEIMRERHAIDAAAHAKLTLHQRQVDQQTVDEWQPRQLDKTVADARAELGKAVADSPITKALASYLYAQTRRSILWTEQMNAIRSAGRPTAGAQMPPVTGEPIVQELIYRAASAAAEDQLAAEATARHVNRNTIPTEEQS